MRGIGSVVALLIAGCFANAPTVGGADSTGAETTRGSDSGPDSGEGSTTGTTTSSTSEGATTEKTDSTGVTPLDMGSPLQKHGELMIRASLASQPGSIWRVGFGGGAEGCAPMGEPEGPCQSFRCPTAGEPTPHAGAIALNRAGGPLGAPALPDELGHYPPVPYAETPFGPDDEVEFVADGAEVPAFSGSVIAPAALNLLQSGADTVPSATAGLDVTWAPAAAGQRVTLRMRAADHLLACSVGADTGMLQILPSNLAALSGAYDYAVALEQGTEIVAGDWIVQLTVGVVVRGADDEAVAGMVSL
ncbi:MAG: hypothetical protein K1X88_06020 [Nannocystaceae bacterium]|nr:hypothetical protein [Nannocystaceae bacterium]